MTMATSNPPIAHNGESFEWPVKRREFQNAFMDSTIWNQFEFRPDDIVIASWAKSGTTWTQQIVSQLVFHGADDINPHGPSPWLDFTMTPGNTVEDLESQTHRRFVKTHLPLDAMVFSPKAKYIYLARDGRDVIWSLHNHMHTATPAFYKMINDSPGRKGPAVGPPPSSPRDFFLKFLENDADGSMVPSSFWDHIRGWWSARHCPNLLLVNYCDLKADMEKEIKRIAAFLEIDVAPENWPTVLEHCSFPYMKSHSTQMSPHGAEAIWEQGGENFIHKGTNGRWRESLTTKDIAQYEGRARTELGEEASSWLANGRQGKEIL